MSLLARVLLLACLVLLALGAVPARAADGTFAQIFCADPDTGRGVMGADGQFPAGLRILRADHPHFAWAEGQTRCSGMMNGSRGVVLGTSGTSFAVPGGDSGLMLRWEPAPGVTFDQGFLFRWSQMGPSWEDYWSIGLHRGWEDTQWAPPVYDMCESRWNGCRSKGSPDPFTEPNAFWIGRGTSTDPSGRPFNGFNLVLRCAAGGCPAGPDDFLRVYGGKMYLRDATSPRLAGAVSGSLLEGGALRGVVDAGFDAADSGSGVYRVRAVVDGVPRPWRSAHPNGGQCQDIDQSDGDAYEFASSAPCRHEVNTSISLDTRGVDDGRHEVRLQAEDAAGNLSTLLTRTVTVDNIDPPSAVADPVVVGDARDGAALQAVDGEWDDHGAPSPLVISSRWERCSASGEPSSCSDAGAEAPVLDDADVGKRFRVVETATNAEGTTSAASEMTEVVVDVPAPASTRLPSLLGAARRGNTLVAQAAGWNDHEADGDPVIARQWQRCRYDGSACADVPGAVGATFELTTADLNRRLQVVETAANAEGTGRAVSGQSGRVTREDGTLPPDNNGEDDDGDGSVDEPGETPPSAGSGTGASGASGTPGQNGRDGTSATSTHTSTSSHSATSTSAASRTSASTLVLNGENASRGARLVVGFRDANRGVMTVGFGRGAAVVGRLVDESGRPLAGAAIEVTHTLAVRGATAAARPAVRTGPDGRFDYTLDRRTPSGTIRFAYAYARGEQPVAVDELDLRVKAAVAFKAVLRGVVVTYRGQVTSGPVPRGKLVLVQGRVKGRAWQTFASRRATSTGRFSGKYRLKVRVPGRKLQFRARVVAESGFPYLTNTSRAVTRTVR